MADLKDMKDKKLNEEKLEDVSGGVVVTDELAKSMIQDGQSGKTLGFFDWIWGDEHGPNRWKDFIESIF